MDASSFYYFAQVTIYWYVTFQVNSVVADVSFLEDAQISSVLGENLLK